MIAAIELATWYAMVRYDCSLRVHHIWAGLGELRPSLWAVAYDSTH